MIKKIKSGFGVYDSTGKKLLGKHQTKQQALRQLRAIEANKNKRNYLD